MERHGDHGFDLVKLDDDHTVIVGTAARIQFLIITGAAVDLIEILNPLVCGPDGGQAGGLSGHDIDADPVLGAEVLNARSHKLHNLVVDIAVCENCADDGQSHVLGADTLHGFACQVDADNARHVDVVGSAQQLLGQLAAALADGHGTQGTVAGVAVRAQDHAAAGCHHLSGKLVDDCLMGRNIDAAVLLGAGQAKHVVIFIDGTADSAKAVVAVGQNVRDRKLLQSAGSGCLDDAHIGNIMRSQLVELDLQLAHIV